MSIDTANRPFSSQYIALGSIYGHGRLDESWDGGEVHGTGGDDVCANRGLRVGRRGKCKEEGEGIIFGPVRN